MKEKFYYTMKAVILILGLSVGVLGREGPESPLFNFQIGSLDGDDGGFGHGGPPPKRGGGGGLMSSLFGGLFGGGNKRNKNNGGIGNHYSSSPSGGGVEYSGNGVPTSFSGGGGEHKGHHGSSNEGPSPILGPMPSNYPPVPQNNGHSQQAPQHQAPPQQAHPQQGIKTVGQGGGGGGPEVTTMSAGLIRANELLSEGEKLGYKPGPPPGFTDFSYGRRPSGGKRGPPPPKRSRFPSILSSMFSWSDDNNDNNHESGPPRHYSGGGQQQPAAASEPFPVRLGSAIKGFFGGGGPSRGHPNRHHQQHQPEEQVEHQQHPSSAQRPHHQHQPYAASGSSHFYSILPQELTHPSTHSTRPQRQNNDKKTLTLASRPEIPFPSLTFAQRSDIVEVPQ